MFGQERALMVLQVCAKCGVREKSGSLDFGQKVVKMARNGGGVCRLILKQKNGKYREF